MLNICIYMLNKKYMIYTQLHTLYIYIYILYNVIYIYVYNRYNIYILYLFYSRKKTKTNLYGK